MGHSLAVGRMMAELATVYALDPAQAIAAGWLHDAAKDLPLEAQLALAEEAGIEFEHPSERHPIYLHTGVGAYLVSKELGLRDEELLDAIATHSYVGQSPHFDSNLSRCLRFADVLSPLKPWQGMEKLQRWVFEKRSDEATLLHCAWLIEYLEQQDLPVHPNLPRLYRSLRAQLNVPQVFFDRS